MRTRTGFRRIGLNHDIARGTDPELHNVRSEPAAVAQLPVDPIAWPKADILINPGIVLGIELGELHAASRDHAGERASPEFDKAAGKRARRGTGSRSVMKRVCRFPSQHLIRVELNEAAVGCKDGILHAQIEEASLDILRLRRGAGYQKDKCQPAEEADAIRPNPAYGIENPQEIGEMDHRMSLPPRQFG